MKKLFFIAVLFLSIRSAAQDTALLQPIDSSSVTVHKDQRLDLLITRQIQANELASRDARRTAKGFRLLIISTNNRDEAISTKSKVYTYFPELKSYLWYQSPYYRVKAGNFKERKDAEEYQKKLNAYFPKGVFIMNDIVEVKLDIPWDEEL